MVIYSNILWCFSFCPSVALLFIILTVLRRRRDTDGELNVARAPLLGKERPQGRYYGIPCDAEPVYAGW